MQDHLREILPATWRRLVAGLSPHVAHAHPAAGWSNLVQLVYWEYYRNGICVLKQGGKRWQ